MFGRKIPQDGYIDMHCHIVPGVDDGAKDMETALSMLKIAYEDGIRAMIATPHYHPDKVLVDEALVYESFCTLKDEAEKQFQDMKLYYGREIYCDYDSVDVLCERKLKLTMCDTEYVLVEFPTSVEYQYLQNMVRRLIMSGYIPIIAHIERYECLVSHPERVAELHNMNIVMQVNAVSVMGNMGKEIKKFVKNLLKNNLIDLVASDAHSAGRRTPRLRKAAVYVGRKYGVHTMERLFIDNQRRVIGGKFMEEAL